MGRKSEAKEYTLAKTPYIVNSLDISTGHITQQDDIQLKADVAGCGADALIVYDYAEGYFVYIPDKDDIPGLVNAGYSQELINILLRGRELGCKYVQFDCDGTTYADLPYFDW